MALHTPARLLAVALALALGAASCGSAEPPAGAASPAAMQPATPASPPAAPAPAPAPAPAQAALPTSAEGLPTAELAKDLVIRDLAPGVHVIVHSHPWAANSLLVQMANGDLVLCDPTYTPAAMRLVLAWAKQRYGDRRIVAINTHFHVDRIGGNEALLEQKIPIHGSDLLAKTLAERGAAHRRWVLENVKDQAALTAEYRTQKDIPPDHLFPAAQGLTLPFGDEQVVLHYPGPGHSPDNLVVYFPSRGILFGGCLVAAGERIGNTTDADLTRWGDSIRDLRRFTPKVVIPGHGDRYDPGLLDHTLKLLADAPR